MLILFWLLFLSSAISMKNYHNDIIWAIHDISVRNDSEIITGGETFFQQRGRPPDFGYFKQGHTHNLGAHL